MSPLSPLMKSSYCTHCSENRYLLFLTENYAALDILEHYIRGKKHERVGALEPEETVATTHTWKPFTLFGSSFPKDKEYTQVLSFLQYFMVCEMLMCVLYF